MNHRPRTVYRGALAFLGAAVLSGGIAVSAAGPRRLATVGVLLHRLARGTSRDVPSDLRLLGRNGQGLAFVQRFLEDRAREGDDLARAAAFEALARGYPGSELTRAVRDYEALSGEPYFRGAGCWEKLREGTGARGARAELTLGEAIERWESFCRAHPGFPGRDDAGLRLARCLEEAGQPRRALDALVEALGWGDGDCAALVRDRIANVVDAQLDLDEALTLATSPPRDDLRAALAYAGAVKLARAHRFDEAAAALERFLALPLAGTSRELAALAPAYFVPRDGSGAARLREDAFRADVAAQGALWAELGALARAGAFSAMGERLLPEPHAFENLMLHDRVISDRHGHAIDANRIARDDLAFVAFAGQRNHLAQAALLFDRGEARARTPEGRRGALAGAAVARLGLLGFWGTRQGHAVPEDEGERLDAAARSLAAALVAAPAGPARTALDATIAAALAFSGLGDDAPGTCSELRRRTAELLSPPHLALAPAKEMTRGR